jgi:glyceraldehyde-3-phosphate dehydrogenase (NADP+)
MAEMLIGGDRLSAAQRIEVRSPFDGTVLDTVPRARAGDVDLALNAASAGASFMRRTSGYDRFVWLRRASELLLERKASFAELLSREEGKILAEARFEVDRAVQTLELSAEEARRIAGRGIPLDGAPGGAGKLGFTLRVPCGVVVAITPFNFPLNLVVHKVGPALAAGNAVVLKPATDTPLSALRLVELLWEAGVPPQAIGCLTGGGAELSQALCSDSRVRKISFTGSHEVGEKICRIAGVKRVTMELGSNAPLIVMDDADLAKVIEATVATGYSNAGQVCISTQRVLVDQKVYADFLDGLLPQVEAIRTGDPLADGVQMGPMIRAGDAERVESWLQEAVQGGARLLTGGQRDGAMLRPAVVADVQPTMRVAREELFGPAVAVQRFTDVQEAVRLANDSRYGLAAGIFTENIGRALAFIHEVDAGNLHVNWGPQWRADLMPYGGLKDSGLGKEGPADAVREMTEEKMVVVHG